MKRLKISLQNLGDAQMLTREQLKTVMGGTHTTGPAQECRCADGSIEGEVQDCGTAGDCYWYCDTRGGIACCKQVESYDPPEAGCGI